MEYKAAGGVIDFLLCAAIDGVNNTCKQKYVLLSASVVFSAAAALLLMIFFRRK